MRLLFLPLALAACAPTDARAPLQDAQEALMDAIEASVQLPKEAYPLGEYRRHYAYGDNGQVFAIYLIPMPPPKVDDGCEVMTADFGTRPCTKAEIEEARATNAKMAADRAPAGQRRWMKDTGSLPTIFDGGCAQVTIEYDIASARVLSARCNGHA